MRVLFIWKPLKLKNYSVILLEVIVMKKKKNRLVKIGVVGILLMFVLSVTFPVLRSVAKVGALLVYAFVSYRQIEAMKKQGEEVDKSILFTVVVVVAIGYLLFFT